MMVLNKLFFIKSVYIHCDFSSVELVHESFELVCLFFLGGERSFDVDPDTGEVFIVGRHMFEVGKVYRLAVSAQIKGMVPSGSTPSQLLQVYVGAMNPQFSVPVYETSFYENQSGV